MLAILDHAFSDLTTAAWLELLTDAGVPCAPVNDVPAAFRDPQVEARNAIVDIFL